ncbi:MAG: hypothetical protein AAF721_39935 [Myxococcota bacterium]
MQEHFDAVAQVRDAVVVGELETVAEAAGHLSTQLDAKDYPEEWRSHVQELERVAESLGRPASIEGAARGAAALAGACGGCHRARGVSPNFGDSVEPAEDDTVQARMQRHQWEVERLWEGIVGPSEGAWAEGASAFDGPPGCDAHAGQDGGERQRLCDDVHAFGEAAAKATSATARVEVYAGFLGTCSGCHAPQP